MALFLARADLLKHPHTRQRKELREENMTVMSSLPLFQIRGSRKGVFSVTDVRTVNCFLSDVLIVPVIISMNSRLGKLFSSSSRLEFSPGTGIRYGFFHETTVIKAFSHLYGRFVFFRHPTGCNGALRLRESSESVSPRRSSSRSGIKEIPHFANLRISRAHLTANSRDALPLQL